MVDDSKPQPGATLENNNVKNKLILKIVDEYGNDVTANYNLDNPKNIYGTLRAYSSFSLDSYDYHQYDGTNSYAQSNYRGSTSLDGVSYYADIIGAYDLNYNKLDSCPVDAGVYWMEIDNIRIYNKGKLLTEEVIAKYNITITNNLSVNGKYLANFEIYKQEIHIKPKDVTYDYDGINMSHAESDWEVINVGSSYYSYLPKDHYIKIVTDTEVGIIDGKIDLNDSGYITQARIYNGKGEDVTHNFIVYTSYDESRAAYFLKLYGVKITKSSYKGSIDLNYRYIEISPNAGQEFTYTGEKHIIEVEGDGSSLYEVTPYGSTEKKYLEGLYGLYEGHYLVVNSAEVKANVGSYNNYLDFDVYDQEGNKVTKLYKFAYTTDEDSYMYVKPITITIKTESINLDFDPSGDGYDASKDENNIATVTITDAFGNEVTLFEGHALTFKLKGYINKIGSIKNAVVEAYIYDIETGKVISKGYQIVLVEGTITME